MSPQSLALGPETKRAEFHSRINASVHLPADQAPGIEARETLEQASQAMPTSSRKPNIVLILGSAPDVVRCQMWPRDAFKTIVAINNAWLVRPDYDYLIHADDFPEDRQPDRNGVRFASIVRANEFVPAQNAFGGFVYAGGTMAFTAAYWAIHRLKPDVLAFLGCDMMYDGARGPTHFYGTGTPDPLRSDVTLQSLEAKSARLFVTGIRNGTLCVNLSRLPATRLIFPRLDAGDLMAMPRRTAADLRSRYATEIDEAAESAGRRMEEGLGYFVEDGRYWEQVDRFDPNGLRELDGIWLSSVRRITQPARADGSDPESTASPE